MKKLIVIILMGILSVTLIGCNKYQVKYDKDLLTINLEKENDEIKIMQLTDLHLAYGNDFLDKKTFSLIDKLVENVNPDVIIITGDITMSLLAKKLFKQFINHMDKYDVPWSFVFGNHEMDFHDMKEIIKIIDKTKTKNLYFKVGEDLGENGGYGNFKIEIQNNSNPILNLYMLDTKANRLDGKTDGGVYDYLTINQVDWYKREIVTDDVRSLAFMHIPLRQYLKYYGFDNYKEKTHAQAVDTGFFDAMVNEGNKKTMGVFVGHDHLLDFSFYLDDIMLAYGNVSGFNAYGKKERGARIIEVTKNESNYELNSYLVLENEVLS
ncbi:metallophosphoesterase [Haploplasma axanthum]|nr:metallophosphoesterase [Haploplasma axanthum]